MTAPQLAGLLGDPKFEVRNRAIELLVKMGDDAVESLASVRNSSPDVARIRWLRIIPHWLRPRAAGCPRGAK